jgi:hypothetical protein
MSNRRVRQKDVDLLMTAIIAAEESDYRGLAAAEAKLLKLAAADEMFEAKLIAATTARLALALSCPREEVETAVRVDVARHVSQPLRLLRAEAAGSA